MHASTREAQQPTPPPPLNRDRGQDLIASLPHLLAEAGTTAVDQPDVFSLAPGDMANWSKIVFQSYRNGIWDIYSAMGEGSNQTRLTSSGGTDIYPRFNRGATRIAFVSHRSGNYDIFKMNADGSGVTRLTTTGDNEYSPTWSPDGSKIAFSSYRDGQSEIYVMNPDGSAQTRLTFDGSYDGQPSWSPDGAKIAFVSERANYMKILNSFETSAI